MTQNFKVGDVVRYGVDKQRFPIYDYARGHSANFAEYVTAEIISVGLVSFTTRLDSTSCWTWPRNKPSHHEAKYWPHLLSDADKIDRHEAMHLFLRPESADKMKTVTLTAPNIHPLTAANLAPTPTKESSMSKHILALAANRHSAPETTPLSGRLQDALKVAMEKQAQESAEAAAAEILSMIRTLEVSKERERGSIKAARCLIDTSVKKMAALDRAMEYAGETENFVPLMQLLGVYVDPSFFAQNPEVARTVPADWVAAKESQAEPAPKKSKKSKET